MAKDNLMPAFFSRVNMRLKTPVISILFTSLFMKFPVEHVMHRLFLSQQFGQEGYPVGIFQLKSC